MILLEIIESLIFTIKMAFGIDTKCFSSKSKYRKLSTLTCKRMSSELKHLRYISQSEYIRVCRDVMGNYVAYVFNDDLAKALYNSLNSNKELLNNLPNEFQSLSFTEERKKNAIRFIVFNDDLHEGEDALERFYDLASCFCDIFSGENRIYINYASYFEIATERISFLMCFLLSISLEKYELNYNELTKIITSLLYNYSLFDYTSFDEFRDDILKKDSNILRGLHDCETNQFRTSLPLFMEINILKLVFNKNCFDDYNKFFYDNPFKERNELLSEKALIFDEEAFTEGLEVADENDNFVSYGPQNSFETLLKIKNTKNNWRIRGALESLIQKNLLSDRYVQFIYSLQSDNCYIKYTPANNVTTLKEYIYRIRYSNLFKEKMMSDLILLVNNTFIDNANVIKSIYFDENIDVLDYLCVSSDLKCLSFKSIFVIDFEKKNSNKFDYPLVIMQLIKLYLREYKISVDNIYECEFMRVLPKLFANDLINYLKTNEYTSKGMARKLKSGWIDYYCDQIEFLENISLDNSDVISRTTFFNGITANELIKNIKKAKESIKSANGEKFKDASYIDLDTYLKDFLSKQNLQLSTNELKKLFDAFTYKDLLLVPEKVIISKDYVINDDYQIIGIVWNKSKLYSLSDVIKNKAISSIELYKVISNILHINDSFGYSFLKLNQGVDELLVDDKLRVIFNSTLYRDEKAIFGSYGDGKKVYNSVMDMIYKSFAPFLDQSFTYFGYDEIIHSSCYSRTNSITDVLNNLELCKEHNKWHLKESMCSCCENVYEVDGISLVKESLKHLYSNTVSSFYDKHGMSKDDQIYGYFKSINQDNIRLGIENKIYDKFKYLTPKSIILSSYKNDTDKQSHVTCISYNLYDFSNVVELSYFKAVQRIKVVNLLYNKILPHILDGSFITDKKSIFSSMFVDKTKKGEIIISGLVYLRTDVTLSLDEELKKEYIENTKKLFSGFLKQYIMQDSNLKTELENGNVTLNKLLNDIDSLGFNNEYVREYLEEKDSYCRVHNVHFSKKDVLCPECIKNGIDKSRALIVDGSYLKNLKAQKPEYEGGEANLYLYKKGKVQKIFNSDVNKDFKSKIIGKMLQKSKLFREFNDQNKDVQFVPINKVIYSFDKNILNLEGYTENIIDDSFKISSLKDKTFVKQLGYTREDVIQILISLCKGIEFLHSIGGFIGDLNGGNVLIKDKVVYIIDFDGMSFDDVKNYVYTNMYIYPPSAENKNITKNDDWYSLAVQAFYYLTYSHPFRGVCNNSNVPENEIERMKLGLSVLGNHGITPPSMSIGWNFMPVNLTNFFLRTFEGNKRENMMNILNEFLQYIKENKLKFKEIKRNRKVKKVLSENSYIDSQNNLIYNENVVINLKKYSDYEIICFCNQFIGFFSEKGILVFNDKLGSFYEVEKSYFSYGIKPPFYIQDNKIYYTINTDNGLGSMLYCNLFVDEINTQTGKINTYRIKKATNNKICSLLVTEGDKFVFLEDNISDGTIDIFCNMIKVCSISKHNFNGTVQIGELYDEISGRWLFLLKDDNKKMGIVIDKNKPGYHYEFEINEATFNDHCFYSNVLYYTENGRVCCFNLNTQKMNYIDCDVVDTNSRIKRVDNKFIIINNDKSYMYFKS